MPIASDQPASRPAPHQPARSRSPARTTARCSGCSGSASKQLGQLVVARSPVDAVDRRRTAVDREGDGPGLEERHPGGAAAEVAGGRLEQARQQGGRVRRVLARQRVGQPDRPAQDVVDRQSEGVEGRVADEREADRLDTAGAGQQPTDPAAQSLLAGQTATGGLAGQHGRHLVVADDPGDLLDQVERVAEVGPPRRRGRDERGVLLVEHAADGLEVGDRGGGVDRHAGHPRGQVVAHLDRRLRRRRADDRDAGVGRAAAVRRQQLDDAVGRGLGDDRVDAALVALAGLGGELVALAGAEHRRGVPVGRLDQHRRRGRRHLGGLAAHDAAEADDAGVVGDDQVLGGQRAVDAVEGGQPLPLGGSAHPDRTGELVGVVPVDRAADLEHHVVGDVDGQRDRAHPGLGQPAHHPVGRRCGRVEAGDLAGHEDRAAGRVVDLDRVAVGVGLGHRAVGRVAVRRVVRQRRLAGDAAQGERVRAVGVDLELDDLVARGRAPRRRRRPGHRRRSAAR